MTPRFSNIKMIFNQSVIRIKELSFCLLDKSTDEKKLAFRLVITINSNERNKNKSISERR